MWSAAAHVSAAVSALRLRSHLHAARGSASPASQDRRHGNRCWIHLLLSAEASQTGEREPHTQCIKYCIQTDNLTQRFSTSPTSQRQHLKAYHDISGTSAVMTKLFISINYEWHHIKLTE